MLKVCCDACKKAMVDYNSVTYETKWRLIEVHKPNDNSYAPISEVTLCPDCYHRIGELMNLFTDEQVVDNDGAGND